MLPSYGFERRQIGDRNVGASRYATLGRRKWRSMWRPNICDNTPAGRQSREILASVADLEQRKTNEMVGAELGYRYVDSPVICDIPGGPEHLFRVYEPSTWPGQRARSDRHTGATNLLWEREGKALGVPAYQETEAISLPSAATRHRNGTLAWRDAAGCPAGERRADTGVVRIAQFRHVRDCVRPAGVRQEEKRECLRIRSKTPHPQGARSARQSTTLKTSAHFPALPIVTGTAKTKGLGSRSG